MNKTLLSVLSLAVVATPLSAKTYIFGPTTDVDVEMVQNAYAVGMGLYDGSEEECSLKVITATGKPSLAIDFEKQEHPNSSRKRNARRRFENSLVEMLGLALRANKGKEASGRIDAPRFVRELHNHIDEEDDTVVVLLGNLHWSGEPAFSFIDLSQSDEDRRCRRPSYGSIAANKFLSPFSMEGVPQMSRCRVVWFDPTGDEDSDNDAYKSEVSNFWNCMFNAVSIPMGAVQSNSSTALKMALGESFTPLEFAFDASEQGARMLTIEEIRPWQTFYVDVPAFTDLWVADLSKSQSKVRETMARRMTDARGVSSEYHGLFVFETNGGILYSENEDVLEIAAAFRQVKPKGGADSPGSFAATLKKVRDELRNRRASKASIRILSDVGPSENEATSGEEDHVSILRDILSDGHEVTFVRTNRKLDVRKFIPKEIKIKVVDL